MGARAALIVKEGEQAVQLSITATDGGDDLLILSVTFDGLDGSLGPHTLQVSLPDAGDDTASADLSMAHDADTSMGAGADVQPSPDVLPLSGQFSGSWILSCESYLPGHHVLVSGGHYCDNLEF
jgi:hypothetical protein